MAESSSPTGRTLRPRNTSAVFGYWNALTWTRRWHGRAKASPPLGGRSRCERSFSVRQPTDGKHSHLQRRHYRELRACRRGPNHRSVKHSAGWPGLLILQASREKQNLQDDLSNSGTAVQLYAEGRATSPPEDRYRRMEKSWRSI